MTRQRLRMVVVLTLTRLVINMSRRFPYPFLPTIGRQLNVPLASVQTIMASQAGIGVFSPLVGPLSEIYGRKRVMIGALILMGCASTLGILFPQFWIFALSMIVFGAGKMIFDPVMQAYLGDQIPYERRGFAMGFAELSWAGSLILAAPLAGFLLEGPSGVQKIFGGLTVLLILVILIMWRKLPADHPDKGTKPTFITPQGSWRILRRHPAGLGALAFSLALVTANEIVYINYGIWMEISFGMRLAELGVATITIAAAEVVGEFSVILAADRFGKRRLALIGSAGSSVLYFMIPNLSSSLPLTLFGLFMLFIFVETAIVASLPLFTELIPDARAVMMSSNAGAHAVGRLGGALIGGILYSVSGSFLFVGLIAMIIGLVSFTMMWRVIHESS